MTQTQTMSYTTTWGIDPTCDEFSTCSAMEDLIALKTDYYCGGYTSSTSDSTDYDYECDLVISCLDAAVGCNCVMNIELSATYGVVPYAVDGYNLVLGGYYEGYEIPYCVDGDEVLLATDYEYGMIAERI